MVLFADSIPKGMRTRLKFLRQRLKTATQHSTFYAKLIRYTSQVRKQLAESLTLSKLDYCNKLLFDIPKYTKQQLQKVKNAAADFVLNTYANINDVINIKWLPIEKRLEYSLAVMGFKAICNENLANHLKLTLQVASTRNLQSNNKGILLNINQQSKTFEKQTENIFNKYPKLFDQ